MNAITLVCPHCGAKLTVSPAAPRVVTCPRCLYRLLNPQGGEADTASTAATLPAPPLPMRVLPLETQAHSDTSATIAMLLVLVVLLAVGAFLSATTMGIGSAAFNVLLVLLILTFAAIVIVAGYRNQKRMLAAAAVTATMPPAPRYPSDAVLSYRTPQPSEPTNYVAATGGFFSAIGLCAGGFFLLAATSGMGSQTSSGAAKSERGFFLLLVIAAVIGFMIAAPVLAQRKGWKGFGLGATIGLVLGLLALGPCAFCYLMTLG